MKLIKQFIADAKKQKITMTQKNSIKPVLVNIPTIEIIECQQPCFDEKLFEYNMIQRAREAEAVLVEILTNYQINETTSKLHVTLENLMAKFRSKHSKPTADTITAANVPKIEVIECVASYEEQAMMEVFIQQAKDAESVLERFLNNCECQSDNTEDSMSEENQNKSIKSRQYYFKGSPSRRIAFKGKTREEEDTYHRKKRRIVLDLPANAELENLNDTNLFGTVGLEGKFTAMEV